MKRRKRIDPKQEAALWLKRDVDPPGFKVEYFPEKGRGVVTTVRRAFGEFLLHYAGEILTSEEGERREDLCSSGFRFFFPSGGKQKCVDASDETGRLGRLVNHARKERNAVMKELDGQLVLFCVRDMEVGEEVTYDYGSKNLPWEKPKRKAPSASMPEAAITPEAPSSDTPPGYSASVPEAAITPEAPSSDTPPGYSASVPEAAITPEAPRSDTPPGFSASVPEAAITPEAPSSDTPPGYSASVPEAAITPEAPSSDTPPGYSASVPEAAITPEAPRSDTPPGYSASVPEAAITPEAPSSDTPPGYSASVPEAAITPEAPSSDTPPGYSASVPEAAITPEAPSSDTPPGYSASVPEAAITTEAPRSDTPPGYSASVPEAAITTEAPSSDTPPGYSASVPEAAITPEAPSSDTPPGYSASVPEAAITPEAPSSDTPPGYSASVPEAAITPEAPSSDTPPGYSASVPEAAITPEAPSSDTPPGYSASVPEAAITPEAPSSDTPPGYSASVPEAAITPEAPRSDTPPGYSASVPEAAITPEAPRSDTPPGYSASVPEAAITPEAPSSDTPPGYSASVPEAAITTEAPRSDTPPGYSASVPEAAITPEAPSSDTPPGYSASVPEAAITPEAPRSDTPPGYSASVPEAAITTEAPRSDTPPGYSASVPEAAITTEAPRSDTPPGYSASVPEAAITTEAPRSDTPPGYSASVPEAAITTEAPRSDTPPGYSASVPEAAITTEAPRSDTPPGYSASVPEAAITPEAPSSDTPPGYSASVPEAAITPEAPSSDTPPGYSASVPEAAITPEAPRSDTPPGYSASVPEAAITTEAPRSDTPPGYSAELYATKLTREHEVTDYTDSDSDSSEGQFWGSVVVLKENEENNWFAMCSTVLAIGSARTNDIIVKTATDHEVLIEVNRFGQVFLVEQRTSEVKHLNNNDTFEVGGRMFQWKYPLECNAASMHDPEVPNEPEPMSVPVPFDVPEVPNEPEPMSVPVPFEVPKVPNEPEPMSVPVPFEVPKVPNEPEPMSVPVPFDDPEVPNEPEPMSVPVPFDDPEVPNEPEPMSVPVPFDDPEVPNEPEPMSVPVPFDDPEVPNEPEPMSVPVPFDDPEVPNEPEPMSVPVPFDVPEVPNEPEPMSVPIPFEVPKVPNELEPMSMPVPFEVPEVPNEPEPMSVPIPFEVPKVPNEPEPMSVPVPFDDPEVPNEPEPMSVPIPFEVPKVPNELEPMSVPVPFEVPKVPNEPEPMSVPVHFDVSEVPNEAVGSSYDFVPGSESDESEVVPKLDISGHYMNPDSTTADRCEDDVIDQIQTVKEERVGKHDYSKRHCCLFCGNLNLKMHRHLETKHSDKHIIAKLPKGTRNKLAASQIEREEILDKLRNQGDFMYNVEVLKSLRQGKKAEQLIVARRPSKGTHTAVDYLPCKYCLKFYVKSDLWRHCKTCKHAQIPLVGTVRDVWKESLNFISSGKNLLQGAGVLLSQDDPIDEREEFYHYIISSMADDEIGRIAKRDTGIITYGKSRFETLGRQRAAGVRYNMRLLARIKMRLVKDNPIGEGPNFESFLRPENFLKIVRSVKDVVGVSEERSLNGVIMFNKPEVAKKTGALIKKLGELHEGSILMERNEELRKDISDFLVMYDKHWSEKIGSVAHQTSKERRFNKKEILPATDDIMKLQKYQNEQIKKTMEVLSVEMNQKNWNELAIYILSKVQTFNFRRGNETAKMQLSKYVERANWKLGNKEIYKSLDPMEKELAKRMDLVEVMGKFNKKVPVLLTPAMRAGIDLLVSSRDSCGISGRNPYVFAKGEESYIKGADALNYVLKLAPNLKRPEHLRLPKMRKYLATVTQLFGIEEASLQEVARHMGHELAVHRQFYRLQDDVIELAKISKLLLAVESGKAHQFTGMSIDDIDLDLLPDVVDDDTLAESNQTELDDGESKDEAENDEELHHVPSIDTEPSTSTCVKEAFPEPQLRQKRKRKCGILYNFPESEDEDWNQGHLQPAVEDVSESSDSDVEVGRSRVKKRKKTLNEKKMWTAEEKKLLKPLVDNSVRLGKPPIKECVLQLKKRSTTLEQLHWLKIKHQVWAMAQSEMKKIDKY